LNLKLRLETHPYHFYNTEKYNNEKGMVLVMVSLILLVASWLGADLYVQSILGLKMAVNVEKALQQQIKTENEAMVLLKDRQQALNKYWQEDSKTYFSKFRQQYGEEIMGYLSLDGLIGDGLAPGQAIAKREVGGYKITYSVPILTVPESTSLQISVPTSINIQILSWSK